LLVVGAVDTADATLANLLPSLADTDTSDRAVTIRTLAAAVKVQMSFRRSCVDPDALRREAMQLIWPAGPSASESQHAPTDRDAPAVYNYGRMAHAMGLFGPAAACYRRVMAWLGPGESLHQAAAFNLHLLLLYHGNAADARAAIMSIVW
jgi:hypothetical protein